MGFSPDAKEPMFRMTVKIMLEITLTISQNKSWVGTAQAIPGAEMEQILSWRNT